MVCYLVHIPDGVKLPGVTADGCPTKVLPGEYLVHELQPKVPTGRTFVRFVGADATCRDVHVPLEAAKNFLGDCSNDASATEFTQAA